jgi:hypothetical protein
MTRAEYLSADQVIDQLNKRRDSYVMGVLVHAEAGMRRGH